MQLGLHNHNMSKIKHYFHLVHAFLCALLIHSIVNASNKVLHILLILMTEQSSEQISPFRDHFVYTPSQWETALQCNVVSHWLGAYTKWSLSFKRKTNPCIWVCVYEFQHVNVESLVLVLVSCFVYLILWYYIQYMFFKDAHFCVAAREGYILQKWLFFY